MKEQLGLKQSSYLTIFGDSKLYRVYHPDQDRIAAYQGAESHIFASLLNSIRSGEPQQILQEVVSVHRSCLIRKDNYTEKLSVVFLQKLRCISLN